MYLRQIALTNFRNYARLGLNLGPGVTVFYGDNAQGKSNLLEAVHVLATTKSMRASADRELVDWRALDSGAPFARIEGRIGRDGAELHVELLLRSDQTDGLGPPRREGGRAGDGVGRANGNGLLFGKTIRVNGLPSRAAQLVGQVNVVLFSPEDVSLAAGPPSGRRRYLDITNSQVNPLYLRSLQRYNRLLIQRNNLLRQVRERRQPRELLEPWNDEQVALGSEVLAQRLRMIAGINAVVAERFRQLSGTQQTLEIVYLPTCAPLGRSGADGTETSAPGDSTTWAGSPGPPSAAELEGVFRACLAEVAGREVEQAVSLIGPHRDDFAFRLDGMDVNTYGSRGQQRLVVLALKLAEAEFMQAETGERPIMLLDDVFSELDPARRAFVLERATGDGQTLITTTDLHDLSPAFLRRADLFRVEMGTVERVSDGEPALSKVAEPEAPYPAAEG